MLTLLILLFGSSSFASPAAPVTIDFEKQVWPILERSCVSCHQAPYDDENGRTRKPKAGLRLDGKSWILKGSKTARVVAPGHPRQSSLYLRTILPEDDGDFMPARGEALTKDETDVLRQWIEQGASFGSWTGVDGPQHVEAPKRRSIPSRIALLHKLSAGVSRAPKAAVAKVRAANAIVEEAVPGSPLLRVHFASYEPSVDAPTIKLLETLSTQITVLDLARTPIGDKALSSIGKMKRLTKLDLRQTAITDRGVAALSKLKELRTLNLYGTQITDKALEHLAELPNLEKVYLAKSKVSDEGVAKLRELKPKMKIVHRLELPTPARPTNADDDEVLPRRGKKKKKK